MKKLLASFGNQFSNFLEVYTGRLKNISFKNEVNIYRKVGGVEFGKKKVKVS
jgi:hypothetical protein